MNLAEQLHKAHDIKNKIEDVIFNLFEQYEPDIASQLDFTIDSDWYDNSIEIYFKNELPYPYEPCKKIRQGVFELGFSNVYWNFKIDKIYEDEIRNYEPRHYKDSSKWKYHKYGYVDDRFNEQEWEEKYQK